jgi:hypothetical protein
MALMLLVALLMQSDTIPLTQVEITVDRPFNGGGCIGPCVGYWFTIRGDGLVTNGWTGQETRATRTKQISPTIVIELVNDMLALRFTELPRLFGYPTGSIKQDGDAVRVFSYGPPADDPIARVTLRIGPTLKTVTLRQFNHEGSNPADLVQLVRRLETLGGPGAWGNP